MSSAASLIQKCGLIAVVCSAWNLLGDLFFMDFYTAHLSLDEFGMIRDTPQTGYLFFTSSAWAFVAQSGAWMYPAWALVTVLPISLGLQEKEMQTDLSDSNIRPGWKTLAPCALLFYGLCIMGGGLHNAFVYLTVLPTVLHQEENAQENYSSLFGNEQFVSFLNASQSKVINHIIMGSVPGAIACNVAAIWIAVLVHCRPTRFPKSYNWFNPLVTSFWVQIVGALLPEPLGFYFAGCLGTWGILILNLATTFMLQDADNTAFAGVTDNSHSLIGTGYNTIS